MSANVESMVYVGQKPWHGLGTEIPDNLTPEKVLITAGLDWTVSKRPLSFSGSYTDADGQLQGNQNAIKGRYALVRDKDDQFLDIVGKTFVPTQNADAFEFFDKFVKEAKLKMCTAGSLCQGQYVWALAETQQSFSIGSANDKVDSYILLVSPHQFGRALIAQQTTVRVVCENTLNLALNEKGMTSYRLPHVREFNAEAKKSAAEVLGLVSDSFSKFKEQVNLLAEKKFNRVDAIDFYGDLLRLKDDTMSAVNDDGLPKSRLLKQFMSAYEGGSPGADLPGTKGTLWGIVNGVTYVLDHASVRDNERSLKDGWFGWRGELKRRALNLALQQAA